MKSIALRQWEAAAYAAGRLTQIRRVCRPQPEVGRYGNGEIIGKVKNQIGGGDYHIWKSKILGTIPLTTDCIYQLHRTSPYGAPGDTLALRETWAYVTEGDIEDAHYVYRADYKPGARLYEYPCGCGFCPDDPECARWKSSTSMRLSAVRWHPVITAVRLERVQDMSEADARACGSYKGRCECMPRGKDRIPIMAAFKLEWCHVHGNEYSHQFNRDNPRTPWESNPWCWALDVEGVKV